METAVTTVEPVQLERFDEMLRRMADHYEELRSMKLGRDQAELALEYAREAQEVLDIIDASPAERQKRILFEAHKVQSSIVKKARAMPEMLRKLCNDIRSSYEFHRRQKIEQERYKREEEANRLEAERRKAELEHLQKIGKIEEAAARAAEPIQPVTVNVDEDAGKPEGEMFVEVWRPKRDERGVIEFTDLTAYLTWVAGNPAFHYLVKHEYGKLKTLLTSNRGMMQPPGLVVEHKFEPRTTREDE